MLLGFNAQVDAEASRAFAEAVKGGLGKAVDVQRFVDALRYVPADGTPVTLSAIA